MSAAMHELSRTAHSTATPCVARVSVVPDSFVTQKFRTCVDLFLRFGVTSSAYLLREPSTREDERKRAERDQKKIVALPIPAIPVRREVRNEERELRLQM